MFCPQIEAVGAQLAHDIEENCLPVKQGWSEVQMANQFLSLSFALFGDWLVLCDHIKVTKTLMLIPRMFYEC